MLVSASQGEYSVDPHRGHLGYVYYNKVCIYIFRSVLGDSMSRLKIFFVLLKTIKI